MSCPERHARNTSFSFTAVQKISLNDSLGLELFVFFSRYIEDLFTKRLCLGLTFAQRNLNSKSTVSKSRFFLHVIFGTVWNCFLTCNYLPQIITCIRHIKPLSLSFITSTFISSSLPFTLKINFLSFKCHIRNFWNGPEVKFSRKTTSTRIQKFVKQTLCFLFIFTMQHNTTLDIMTWV